MPDAATLAVLAGVITIGVPAIITAYTGLKASSNAREEARAVRLELLESKKLQLETLEQTKIIHVAVNSNLTDLKNELAKYILETAGYVKEIAELNETIKSMTANAIVHENKTITDRITILEGKRKDSEVKKSQV